MTATAKSEQKEQIQNLTMKARNLESTKKGLFFYRTPSSFVFSPFRVFVIDLLFGYTLKRSAPPPAVGRLSAAVIYQRSAIGKQARSFRI